VSFTADEFLRMAETGIPCEDDRLELIDGEVLETSPIVEQFRRGQSIAPKLLPACVIAVDVFFPESSPNYFAEAARRSCRFCRRSCRMSRVSFLTSFTSCRRSFLSA
jgi:hypothetical protein